MGKTTSKALDEVLNQLPAEFRKKFDEYADELIVELMSLRELRKDQEQTQEKLAETLGITQENISRIETRRDILVSTLRRQVEALGGRLVLLVKFPDRRSVELTGIADSDDSKP